MKARYIPFLVIAIALASCSSSYRGTQTPDDVYYSPTPEPPTYVTVTSQEDEDSYGYRNDVQEDWQIRRGIRDSRYRTSISINYGIGYPYYSPFYSPFYNSPFYPYLGWGYNTYINPYSSFGMYNYYSGYYGFNSFYNPYTTPFGYYHPGYYGGYGYSGYYPHGGLYNNNYYPGSSINKDNGPRTENMNAYGNNGINRRIISGNNNNTDRPNIAPVRTMQRPPNSNTGIGNSIRRVFTPKERRTTPQTNRSNNERRYTPPSNQPTRTFEPRSNPAPSPTIERSPSNTNTNSGGKSAPVRKF